MKKSQIDLITSHGLTMEEYNLIKKGLKRAPQITELGIFSAMWSEHCSYKSSKIWLKKLFTKNKYVIQGPGENAGVIDIGDNKAAVFKIESHNHPSFIEPYQGAATGVGGILRDIFTMGARPIACLNSLRFGDVSHPKTKHLLAGVVSGIGGYGNCIGIPTVGGESFFDSSYNNNILVNAMAVGIADKNKIFYSSAQGIGNDVVYVGSKTGRDGIHGATMASAEFDKQSESKKPTVQVGDPFTEKLLLESCLELMQTNAIVAIQDMGAAGLTSSSIEMASKGNVGIEINIDKIPLREKNMTPYEIMLSESQERMLMIINPKYKKLSKKIFDKWNVDFHIIGKITNGNNLTILKQNKKVADIPLKVISDNMPCYKRKWTVKKIKKTVKRAEYKMNVNPVSAILKILNSPNGSSRKWIWEQYDHMVMGDTVQRPGGDAAVIRIHGTKKGLALSVDSTIRYCRNAPKEGAKQAVAEVWRNISATGAKPIAITNCLNFGNPEKPEIMGEFVESIKGINEACTKLNFPVISGNVSFYNETESKGIAPTPVIGGVGVINDISKTITISLKKRGNLLLVVGKTNGHLDCSLYSKEIYKTEFNLPPKVNLDTEIKNGKFIRDNIEKSLIQSAHDISDGGLIIAISEMAISGNLGAMIHRDNKRLPLNAFLFAEDQGRYIIEVSSKDFNKITKAAKKNKVYLEKIGEIIDKSLNIETLKPISIERLIKAYTGWLPEYMKKN